jgi:hypothetical protein
LALLPLLALLARVARVAAAEDVEPSRLVYSAEGVERCPTARDFEASVRERIRRGRLADAEEPAREYRVEMRAVGSRVVARLDFAEANGAKRTREVASETCADAASAIALVTALAIDAAGTEHADDGGAGEGTLTPSEALGLVPPANATPAAVAPAAKSPAPVVKPAAPVSLFASLGADGTVPWLVDLGFAGERGSQEPNGPGSTRFSFLGARVRGCVFAWQPIPTLDVQPCAVIETGAVVAEGFIQHPETQVDGWFAAGVAGRVTLRIGPAAIAAEVGPLFPITRNHYVFGPVTSRDAVSVHEVGPVGAYASLGVALQIF